MKNIYRKFGAFLLGISFLFLSCEEETIVFDNINGQTGVSFGTTSYNVSVPEDGLSLTIPVNVTTVSDSDRTFDVNVLESSVGEASNYNVGTVTIPAGQYNGMLDVSLNFDPLIDGAVYRLLVRLSPPAGGVVFDETVTIEYFKEIICNDFLLTVVTDTYGAETTWDITDESGTVVVSGGPYSNVSGGDTYTAEFFLEDGCYTFTVYDAFGDGQSDGTNTGSVTLECSILDVFVAGGNFGSSQSTEFCVNQ